MGSSAASAAACTPQRATGRLAGRCRADPLPAMPSLTCSRSSLWYKRSAMYEFLCHRWKKRMTGWKRPWHRSGACYSTEIWISAKEQKWTRFSISTLEELIHEELWIKSPLGILKKSLKVNENVMNGEWQGKIETCLRGVKSTPSQWTLTVIQCKWTQLIIIIA